MDSPLSRRITKLEDAVMLHLMESSGIKTQLKINTWLTGIILAALIGKIVAGWF